ncbi:MAG: hypothetical protein ABL872_11665 [Lacibacter sp.]
MSYRILFTTEFEKELKKLSSKYPSLRYDFSVFLQELSINPIQGTSLGNQCYKIRFAIRSKGKGKSGGARVISFVQIVKETVVLISIYDKSVKESISNEEIKERLKKYLN